MLCICSIGLVCWFWTVVITLTQAGNAEWRNPIQALNILNQIPHSKDVHKANHRLGWRRWKGCICRAAPFHSPNTFWLMTVGSYGAGQLAKLGGCDRGGGISLSQCRPSVMNTGLTHCISAPRTSVSKHQGQQHFLKSCRSAWFLLSLHCTEASARAHFLRC